VGLSSTRVGNCTFTPSTFAVPRVSTSALESEKISNGDDVALCPACPVFLCVRRSARGRRLVNRTVLVCHDRLPKPCSQTNALPVESPSAVCRRRCATSLASVRGSDWQAGCKVRLVGSLSPLFLAARRTPIRRPSSRSQEPRSCAFRQLSRTALCEHPQMTPRPVQRTPGVSGGGLHRRLCLHHLPDFV
jgi:hypothetical protein